MEFFFSQLSSEALVGKPFAHDVNDDEFANKCAYQWFVPYSENRLSKATKEIG
jgi:hypothetical protein